MEFSNRYVLGFTVLLCLVCAFGVSTAAVALKERQEANQLLDRQANILRVAGLIDAGAKVSPAEAEEFFQTINTVVIDRATGEPTDIDPVTFSAHAESKSTETSDEVPDPHGRTQVSGLPDHLLVYEVTTPGKECFVLEIWGNGLWSTLFGYLALSSDLEQVVGITYYEHGETPGLGGEVDNPNWKALWPGKRAFDDQGATLIEVVKAGSIQPDKADWQVNGMSGATITTNGVSWMVQLWLGEHGYGPYFDRIRGKS